MKLAKLLPDLPCAFPSLPFIFSETHQKYAAEIPGWTVSATSRKLKTDYWLNIVLPHFAHIFITGAFFALLFAYHFLNGFVITLFPVGLVIYLILALSMYWPLYYLEYLPRLEICAENYKQNELEGLQRCKKEQYSVLSLMLIQYVCFELTGIGTPVTNTACVALLSRQYGISVKSVGPALQLIQRATWNRKSIRKRTEITDDFETAKEYFRQLNAEKAIKFLDRLQMKVLQ